MRSLSRRGRAWLASLAIGSPFVLGGCDPTVRETVLSGVAEAATGLTGTFIQAFFQSLLAPEEDSDAPTTVMRPIVETAIFA